MAAPPKQQHLHESATGATPAKSPTALWGKSVLAAIAITAVVGGITLATGGVGGASWFTQSSDTMPEQQRHERMAAFNNLTPMTLSVVPDSELPKAVASMGLPAQDNGSIQADLHSPPQAASQNPSAQAEAPAATEKMQPVKQAAPAPQEKALKLAWITLWDTDAEDGDVVKIDSQGYSRTVVLRKQPVTFAVPVPDNGLINVTGIRDGDGGGITVGLGSGDMKAVFPIMSEGQTLALHVRMN